MSHDQDEPSPPDPDERPPAGVGPGEVGRKLDEDAAWREIVANYGERARLADHDLPAAAEPSRRQQPRPQPEPEPRVNEEREELNTAASWDDEGHFIPPDPPPLPPLEPRRRLAWAGLFAGPLFLLAAVAFGWSYPGWAAFLLVGGFLGGFGYLVATMPRERPTDGRSDDGAVV